MPDDKTQTTQTQTEPGGEKPPSQTIQWDEWLKGQPDEIRTAYESHTTGLKTALQSERQQRGELEKQLREAAAKADKGSEAQQQLTGMADKLAALESQQDFYDQAHKVGVTDLKLAYIVAREEGLIDARGRVNFDGLKKAHPALFGVVQPVARIDGGAGKQPPSASMDGFIRRASGR